MGRRYHHAKLPSNGFVAEILLTANPRGGVIIIDKDNAYYTTCTDSTTGWRQTGRVSRLSVLRQRVLCCYGGRHDIGSKCFAEPQILRCGLRRGLGTGMEEFSLCCGRELGRWPTSCARSLDPDIPGSSSGEE